MKNSFLFLIVLVFLFTVGSSSAQSLASLFPPGVNVTGTYEAPSGRFSFAWGVDNAARRVVMAARGSTTGWVGVGWSHTPRMIGGDMIVSSVDSGNVTTMTDRQTRTLNTRSKPPNDGPDRQDFTLFQGFEADGQTFLCFARDFVTNDTLFDLDILNTTYLLWALGDDGNDIYNDNFAQHSAPGVVVEIVWVTAASQDPVNTRGDLSDLYIHAGLEIFAYGFLLVIGQAIPLGMKKVFKKDKRIWVPAHAVLQVSGLILAFAGLGVAKSYIDSDQLGTEAPREAHEILGFIALALVALSLALGLVLPFLFKRGDKDDDKKKVRKVFSYIHTYVAYLCLIFGFVAVWTGFDRFSGLDKIESTPTACWVLFSVWVGFSFILFFIFKVFSKLPSFAVVGLWVFWVIVGLGLLLPIPILISDGNVKPSFA